MTITLIPDPVLASGAGDGASATPRCDLSHEERAELHVLLATHFDGVDADQFGRDLDEKDWVLRIRRDGRLVGFTTLQVYPSDATGTRCNIVYSGDTIVAPEAWGSPALARGWISLVRALQRERPGEPWYWLLLSSGFRTYRFLPVFWREFWPRYDAEPAPARATMLDTLARERFGTLYDSERGVVRFPCPQRLRAALAAVPDGRDDDPHIRYFLHRNPGHAAGDELVCLTSLHDDNLSAAGARMVRASRP